MVTGNGMNRISAPARNTPIGMEHEPGDEAGQQQVIDTMLQNDDRQNRDHRTGWTSQIVHTQAAKN